MYVNKVKEKLKRKEPVIGMHMYQFDREVIEISGILGLDYIMLDLEHGPLGPAEVQDYCVWCERRDVVPMARISENDEKYILKLLECGIMGIMYPGIETADDVRKILDYSKYYPMGRRGISFARAADFAIGVDKREYQLMANDNIIVIPQLESPEAIGNLEEIASIPGVDWIGWGPNDYSQCLGIPTQVGDPRVVAAGEKIKEVSRAHGLPVMYVADTPEAVKRGLAAEDISPKVFGIAFNNTFAAALKGIMDAMNGR